ncbi:hypothetical protein BH10PLA1_BH10PLA1_19140 [soil metagenome]
MQVVLIMFRSDGERRSFSVTRDVTVIGRREDCDLRIPLTEVSRKHCRILRDGETLRIEDLGSSNGTFHNGVRIQDSELAPGDTIKVGPVVFCIQMDGVPAEEDMTPILPSEEEPQHSSEGMADNSSELSPRESMPAAEPLAMEEVPGEHDLGAAVGMEEELPSPGELESPAAIPLSHAEPVEALETLPLEEVESAGDESFTMEVEESAGEEGQASEDIVEDFDIIDEEESHDSQGGDIHVDTEQK